MATRRERGLYDKLYLVDIKNQQQKNTKHFSVMGTTGNVYTVIIDNYPRCDCPDFVRRDENCKHLYFIFLKVLKGTGYLKKYMSERNLQDLFKNIDSIKDKLYAEENLRNAYIEKLKEESEDNKNNMGFKSQKKDDDCPICMEKLENGEEIDYCKYGCGKSIHSQCFIIWSMKNKDNCVFCRSEWIKNQDENKNDEYLNLYNATNKNIPSRNYRYNRKYDYYYYENDSSYEFSSNNFSDEISHEDKSFEKKDLEKNILEFDFIKSDRSSFDFFERIEMEKFLHEGKIKNNKEISDQVKLNWTAISNKEKKIYNELEELDKKRALLDYKIKEKINEIKQKHLLNDNKKNLKDKKKKLKK